jgi:hypothetical protein
MKTTDIIQVSDEIMGRLVNDWVKSKLGHCEVCERGKK